MPGAVTRIDQFVPALARHDAIGNHVFQLRKLFRSAGYESSIFYEHIDPQLSAEADHYLGADPSPNPGRVILYHASTNADMTEWLVSSAARGQRIILDYHNITPACYFARWEPRAARSMELARRQLAELAPWVSGALADSQYNAEELAEFGIREAVACPILLDIEEYHAAPDPARVAALEGQHPRWLFVGRVAPNKCQHDVVAAFAVYRRLYAPDARLAIVGGTTSPRYRAAVRDMADEFGLGDAVEFTGSTPFGELLAYFAQADVFVCLSEHEGFCVPVIEAMELGVPVVAYAAAAVTETVADAGVLLSDKDPLVVAAAVDALLSDEQRKQEVAAAGRERAGAFSFDVTAKRWLEQLAMLTGSPVP